MRIVALVGALVLFGYVASASSFAQGLTAVRPIPGYGCMALKMTPQQMMDPTYVVPLYSQPSANSAVLGRASAIVIVASPTREANGYIAALLLDGKTGWISASFLKPWQSFGSVRQKCIPSVMSNGRIGFDFKNQSGGG